MSGKPEWLSKLEKADKEGKTVQSKSGQTIAGNSGGASSSSSKTIDSLNYESELNRIAEAQRKAAIDKLNTAKNNAIANLKSQKEQITPYYTNQKQVTTGNSNTGAKNLASYLAKRGLNTSGVQAQSEMNRINQLNSNINSINTAQTNALKDIDNQITQTRNDYEGQIATVQNTLDAENAQRLLDYKQQVYQQQVADQKEKEQQEWNRQLETIGAYYDNYQAEINRRMAIDPNDPYIPYLQLARQQKIRELEEAKNTAAETAKENAYEKLKILGQADQEVASILGIPVGTKTADYKQMLNDAYYKNASLNAKSTTTPTSYKDNPNWFNDLAAITTGKITYDQVANDVEIIADLKQEYGEDGYYQLLLQAQKQIE